MKALIAFFSLATMVVIFMDFGCCSALDGDGYGAGSQ
jgi:hypothetical protein